MDCELDSVMAGAPFFTAKSVARVVKRVPYGRGGRDDCILLEVAPSPTHPGYKAWTTVDALSLALDTGGWSRCKPASARA